MGGWGTGVLFAGMILRVGLVGSRGWTRAGAGASNFWRAIRWPRDGRAARRTKLSIVSGVSSPNVRSGCVSDTYLGQVPAMNGAALDDFSSIELSCIDLTNSKLAVVTICPAPTTWPSSE